MFDRIGCWVASFGPEPLDPKREYDLLVLSRRRAVRVRATGQSITNVLGAIQNLSDLPLRGVITPGTYFIASGNRHIHCLLAAENQLCENVLGISLMAPHPRYLPSLRLLLCPGW